MIDFDSPLSFLVMQIANFYGSINDELSQPRHCWDASGKYIYGVSDDLSYGKQSREVFSSLDLSGLLHLCLGDS